MLTRVIAALALVPLFIFIVIGGIPLYIAEIVILAMALREFYKAFNAKDIHPIENIGYIFIAYMGLKNILNLGVEYTYIMIFLLFMYSITYLLRCKNNVIDIAITFFSIFYVAISIDFIVLTINSFERGAIYVWTIFIVAFLTDTFAYFTGYLFGKHKLIPKVSPKKTVEGSIGGIIGSTVGCIIFGYLTDTFAYFTGYLFGKHKLIPKVSPKKTVEGSIGGIIGSTVGCIIFGYLFNLDMTAMVIIGSIGSIVAQFGDLFASSIKRYVGIKDYGKLIPGHGLFNLDMTAMVIIGSIGSIVAQFGDLFASSIKRYVGIKDYGKLIPGHGGVLDRFDSVILVAPFVYYAIIIFSK